MRFALLALVGILALPGPGSGPSSPASELLYGPADGPITAFTQDGSLLSWFAPGSGTCNAVHVLSLGGVEAALPYGTSNVTCRWDMVGPAPRLAIAGDRAAALWTLHESATTAFDYVVGATVKQPTERRFSEIAHTKAGAGFWLGGIAGSGTTLAYSVAGVAYVNQLTCLAGGSCAQRISGGGVHIVVGRGDPVLPGTGPALQLATAAGRIAYVPAATVANGQPQASPTKPIVVCDATTGATVATVLPGGTPVALALSTNVLAVLARSTTGLRVTWFDPASGDRLGSVRVSKSAAPELSASDQVIVYHVDRTVKAIDVATGTVTTLAQTDATPIGLSIVGSRLAWAENVHGQGSIRAIFLHGRG